ncbi:MAG: histidinol-phosphatase HisJ family protein [Lachnospiraceae bacterium]|nr:histidinol-phosphatase HisJ family protein [Lachnospiraceae bacterium]
MLKADFHLHSSFSGDSDTAPEQIVETGLLKGLSAVCFTDHFDADYPYDNVCFMLDTEAYLERVLELRSAYEGRIEIGFGVELGLQPHLGELYRSYVGQYPFDFVIGSTHLMDGKDPYYASFWEDCAPKDGIRRFLEITLENMKAFDDFDVYGHLDYIVRYAPLEPKRFFYGDYGDLMDEILRFLISRGKGIEVNTGGYKAGLGCPNPCPEVLRRYRELGGEIVTMGSDAHAAEYVGGFMDTARDVLRDCGFRYFTVFRGREAVFVALD